jgi:hypothetical protein
LKQIETLEGPRMMVAVAVAVAVAVVIMSFGILKI